MTGAQTLPWGNGMGCMFSSRRCNEWPQAAKDQGFFCSTRGETGCTGHNLAIKGYCNIVSYSSALSSHFQYFSDPMLGGSDQTADFCPSMAPYVPIKSNRVSAPYVVPCGLI